MKPYAVTIRWRGYKWSLKAAAVSSIALMAGMLNHVPADAVVTVKREPGWTFTESPRPIKASECGGRISVNHNNAITRTWHSFCVP